MALVRANGLDIAYERVGQGPALVLVHGAAEDGRIWQPQLASLSDELTVVAWDEPGAGRSSDVPAGFALEDYARCLAGLVEALDLAPAHVAGLSWGGTVALELYRHRPELVATLILVDTYAGWRGSLPPEEVEARVAGVHEMLRAPTFDPTLPGLFAAGPPEAFAPLLAQIAADVRRDSLRTAVEVMARADQRDLLPRIGVPTLLVWGELDARSPLTVARQFQQAIPDAELVILSGAGHLSHLERPLEFTAAVRAFCRAHPPGRPARRRSPPAPAVSDGGAEDQVRVAELIASLSLASDLGLGQQLEHELGVCLAALQLAGRLGCDAEDRSDVFYVALLAHVGCTAGAPYFASWVGGDEIRFQRGVQVLGPASEPAEDLRHLVRRLADDRPLPERARLVARQLAGGRRQFELAAAGLCEGGRLLAARLRMRDEVVRALGQVTARWDGKGVPAGVAGEELSRPLRITRVAHDLVAIAHAGGLHAATAALRRRRGRGYDPEVVDAALADVDALQRAADVPDAWERVLAAEPAPQATISRAGLETVGRAFAEFTDLKVGFLRGHSTRVAELAATAAEALGCSRPEVFELRVAGLLHDVGRVAVPNGIWDKPGPLSAGEWERVRLHPYYTERVLERSAALAPLASTAGSHHERLDGSGYHRGATAAQLRVGARLLAAADAFDAMTHDRPHRPAQGSARARAELGRAVEAGVLDKRAVDAVLEAAGAAPTQARPALPAGLTEREVQVLRLVAQGRTNREIAEALVISEKTAGHHVEHIYAKAGVSTRVGAALFAMRHDLLD